MILVISLIHEAPTTSKTAASTVIFTTFGCGFTRYIAPSPTKGGLRDAPIIRLWAAVHCEIYFQVFAIILLVGHLFLLHTKSFIDLQIDQHKVTILTLQLFDCTVKFISSQIENSIFPFVIIPGLNICQHIEAFLHWTKYRLHTFITNQAYISNLHMLSKQFLTALQIKLRT